MGRPINITYTTHTLRFMRLVGKDEDLRIVFSGDRNYEAYASERFVKTLCRLCGLNVQTTLQKAEQPGGVCLADLCANLGVALCIEQIGDRKRALGVTLSQPLADFDDILRAIIELDGRHLTYKDGTVWAFFQLPQWDFEAQFKCRLWACMEWAVDWASSNWWRPALAIDKLPPVPIVHNKFATRIAAMSQWSTPTTIGNVVKAVSPETFEYFQRRMAVAENSWASMYEVHRACRLVSPPPPNLAKAYKKAAALAATSVTQSRKRSMMTPTPVTVADLVRDLVDATGSTKAAVKVLRREGNPRADEVAKSVSPSAPKWIGKLLGGELDLERSRIAFKAWDEPLSATV